MTAATAALARADLACDTRFMRIALALGRRGLGRTWPNPAVGAILVREEAAGPVIVGRGWTQPGGRPHAETEALDRAGDAARGTTLYTTLEPCSHHGNTPPCADAIVAAGIKRVVSALEDPNPQVGGAGHARLRAAGIAVEVGPAAQEAARDNAGHIRRMRDGRPHTTLKLAVSADEKAGLAGRLPANITGEEARARVHMLRAMSDAVLVGAGTTLADDPLLTCRLPGMDHHSPVRIVLDSGLRLPLAGKLVGTAGQVSTWIISGPRVPVEKESALRAQGVETLHADLAGSRVDLSSALTLLAAKGITRILIEAGPTIAASFLQADLVDEAVVFRSPKPLGSQAIDAIAGSSLSALTRSPRFVSRGMEPIGGGDTVEMFERAR